MSERKIIITMHDDKSFEIYYDSSIKINEAIVILDVARFDLLNQYVNKNKKE